MSVPRSTPLACLQLLLWVACCVMHSVHASAASADKLVGKPADNQPELASDTVLTRNRIHITDSRIVLAASDKKALLNAIADAVVARRVKLGPVAGASVGVGRNAAANDDTGSSDDAATANANTGMTLKAASAKPDATTKTATTATPPMRITTATLFPVSHDAFLYYTPDPRDATKSILRLGWRYALADWKLYRALIPATACEVKRTIGSYYYC